MREQATKLKDAGARVYLIDPHEAYRTGHFPGRAGLDPGFTTVPVLADAAQTVSATYGVAFQMSIHTEHSNRPATLIVDREGVVRYARRAKKYNDRPSTDEILEKLAELD